MGLDVAKTKVVFFGSGPVAAQSLQLLLEDFEVTAVVTKPKPAHHRGSFPVIDVAENHGLPMHLVGNKRELSELIATDPFRTELGIIIDFGIIVTGDVIDYFPKGIINSHFSLLPQWRGADPIAFAILSGQKKTGVSLMLIDEGLDTGKLIRQKAWPIKPDATTPSLTEELIILSHELLRKDVPAYLAGELRPRSQPHPDRATHSRKLTKVDGLLDFTKPAEVLEREIRAFTDWPKSRTKLAGIDVIITKAFVSDTSGDPGSVGIKDKKLFICCGEGSLQVERLKPAGKNEMTAAAFIAGYGTRLN